MEHPPSILVIQLKRIGDLILTTPLLNALRNRYPDARLDLLASSESRQIHPAIGCVDHIRVHHRSGGNLPFWLSLSAASYDICIDPTGSDRACLVAWLSKAGRKIAYSKYRDSQIRRAVYTDWVDSPVRNRHTVDHLLDLLAPLGIEPPPRPEPSLHVPEDARHEAREIAARHGLGKGFAILHPGSARREKFWVARRWAETADYLHRRHHLAVVLTGGSGEMESTHIADILRHTATPCIDLSGRISLPVLTALLDGCRLLVGVDSAPLHLASARRTPQIGLYGPTNPFHWHGRYNTALALVAGDPENRLAPRHPKAEMIDLSTERVFHAIDTLIA